MLYLTNLKAQVKLVEVWQHVPIRRQRLKTQVSVRATHCLGAKHTSQMTHKVTETEININSQRLGSEEKENRYIDIYVNSI